MFKILSSKYRSIILSIALFVVLDLSILAMNFYISFAMQGDAQAVSQSGHVQMLSQRLVKSMYELQVAMANDNNSKAPFLEMKSTYQNLEENIEAFKSGGLVHSLNDDLIQINALEDAEGRNIIQKIEQIWLPFKELINPLVGVSKALNEPWFISGLRDAQTYVSANNLYLLIQSSMLARHLEGLANKKAQGLRTVQTVGIAFAIINFLLLVYHFIAQLRKSDEKMLTQQQENRHILDNVNEGLFLLDRELMVAGEHSKYSETLFNNKNISGSAFISLFKEKVSWSDLDLTKKYLNLLIDNSSNEFLLADLNPLRRVKMSFVQTDGQFDNKYLRFSFSRAIDEGQVSQILVTAQDITQQVLLDEENARLKMQQGAQLGILSQIVTYAPDEFLDFTRSSLINLHGINGVLQQTAHNESAYLNKINMISMLLHKVKGETSMFDLEGLVSRIHDMESQLKILKDSEEIEGEDFLPFTSQLKHLLLEFEQFEFIAHKLSHLSQKNILTEHTNDIIERRKLIDLVSGLAKRQHKPVRLKCAQKGKQFIAPDLRRAINDVLIQLTRNALVHGIENQEQRGSKTPRALLDIKIWADENELSIVVHDDGRGFDLQAIKDKALALGHWTQQELDKMNKEEVFNLVFIGDLSTAPVLDRDAGRGFGMSVVKQIVDERQGRIQINSEPGQFCEIALHIPLCSQKDIITPTFQIAS